MNKCEWGEVYYQEEVRAQLVQKQLQQNLVLRRVVNFDEGFTISCIINFSSSALFCCRHFHEVKNGLTRRIHGSDIFYPSPHSFFWDAGCRCPRNKNYLNLVF
mmetsp:Transcript_37112/g.54342  ORF Transcript_37112/g.54342 Transcript_37112/m.54342 type:complete len:103 (-) Transcript_37112:104-412(-)